MTAHPSSRRLVQLSAVFLIITVLVNIAWPLTHDTSRIVCTIVGVLSMSLSALLHLIANRGPRQSFLLCAWVLGGALAVELIGVHARVPFGHYEYTRDLGIDIAGVPLIIPCAWLMMLYPSYVISQRLIRGFLGQALVTGWLMATWDLYLDPQMVHEGYWVWFNQNGEHTMNIPLSNFIGWFACATVLAFGMAVIDKNVQHLASIKVPAALVMWVWIGGIVLNAGWFDPFLNRPTVAVLGFFGMGLVLFPAQRVLWK